MVLSALAAQRDWQRLQARPTHSRSLTTPLGRRSWESGSCLMDFVPACTAHLEAALGLGRIVALYFRSSTSYPYSLTYSVPLLLKRRCDGNPGGAGAARHGAAGAEGLRRGDGASPFLFFDKAGPRQFPFRAVCRRIVHPLCSRHSALVRQVAELGHPLESDDGRRAPQASTLFSHLSHSPPHKTSV